MMMAPSAYLGLFPAAVSTGIGSQVQRPLPTVVVGMLVGALLLLVVVPTLQTSWTGVGATSRRFRQMSTIWRRCDRRATA
jgi:Cu/Ag efflux pump CusA